MPATIGDFKGHATITLTKNERDERGFSFGAAKGRLILANLDAIRRFVADADKAEASEAELRG